MKIYRIELFHVAIPLPKPFYVKTVRDRGLLTALRLTRRRRRE